MPPGKHRCKVIKVFWFFFSKKNSSYPGAFNSNKFSRRNFGATTASRVPSLRAPDAVVSRRDGRTAP